MSRITASQLLIFSSTTLALSLTANVWLFTEYNTLQADFETQSQSVLSLTQDLDTSKQLKGEQIARLDQMNGQQSELADIIQELQTELTTLNRQYQQTLSTADLTRQQLDKAQSEINLLAQQVNTQQTQLADANITIRNQQRALKSALADASTSTDLTATNTRLSTTLTADYSDISVAQTASGETVINIPLAYIFREGTLSFTDDIASILDPIANEINKLPNTEVSVIGHADARPIVSDIAERYPTNWELSSVRASKIVQYFIEHNVKENQLMAAGKASNQPVREEANAEAWAINRRIEIKFH